LVEICVHMCPSSGSECASTPCCLVPSQGSSRFWIRRLLSLLRLGIVMLLLLLLLLLLILIKKRGMAPAAKG
jgi:hypothetical protein